ncbi:phosphate acetyltransferase [Bordetella bronchiseptica]|uniref:phosphate acetyltransferase n=1 Tax=Bordetella bronchiseptica TaxID=518 RepID=UPI0039FCAE43
MRADLHGHLWLAAGAGLGRPGRQGRAAAQASGRFARAPRLHGRARGRVARADRPGRTARSRPAHAAVCQRRRGRRRRAQLRHDPQDARRHRRQAVAAGLQGRHARPGADDAAGRAGGHPRHPQAAGERQRRRHPRHPARDHPCAGGRRPAERPRAREPGRNEAPVPGRRAARRQARRRARARAQGRRAQDGGRQDSDGQDGRQAGRPQGRRPAQGAHGMSATRHNHYERLIAHARTLPALPCAVAHPCDETSLGAALQAMQLGLLTPILVGPQQKIRDVAERCGLDLGGAAIVDAPHSHAAAAAAVQLVRGGQASLLMKGSLHTDELMHEVVARDTGLRTERRISHVFIMDVPTYPEPLFITDAAINIFPDLETKADIVRNAIALHLGLGLGEPRVAILSAVEQVMPSIPSTLEAAALCKMADRGQIQGGILDGPLALDNAISPEAAQVKGIVSPVAGRAQVLVVPDLEAGNMLAKNLSFLANAQAAGIVLGARVPIVLTSRADSAQTRLASCAVATLYAHHLARATPLA